MRYILAGLAVALCLIFPPKTFASDRLCVPQPEAAACLEAGDAAPLGSRLPLLLVHGWNRRGIPAPPPDDLWSNLINYYGQQPNLRSFFKLYTFSYNSNVVPAVILGRAMRDLLDAQSLRDPSNFGSKPLVILAHSMGGIISRYYFQLEQLSGFQTGRPGGERLLSLITLGTPHHGTMLANGHALDSSVVGSPLLGQLLRDLLRLFYGDDSPRWFQPNRTDLFWDNFDGALDYDTFSGERNVLLERLNGSSVYDAKIVGYAGKLSPADVGHEAVYLIGSAFIKARFDYDSDGMVPISSALLYGDAGTASPRIASRILSRHDHSQIARGKPDGELFTRIAGDLIEIVRKFPGPVAAPFSLVATVTGSRVSLSWEPPASGWPPTTYIIEAGSAPGESNLARFFTGTTETRFQTDGVATGVYYVRIRAANAARTSAASNEVRIVVGGAGIPGRPTLTASVNGNTVTVRWTAGPGGAPTSYFLAVGRTSGASDVFAQNVGLNTSGSAGLPDGTYFTRDTALHGAVTSAPSNEATFTVGRPQSHTWTQQFPAESPPPRFGHAIVYDTLRQEVVLFGGRSFGGALLNDTWVWNGSNWRQRFPAMTPPQRITHAMAYDPARGEVVLFGGLGVSGFPNATLGDTWVWDGNNWTQKFPPTSPPLRINHAMTYDSVRQQIVLFGGNIRGFGSGDADTWVWDGNSWTQRLPATNPPGRWNHDMAFDAARGEVVLYSGSGLSGNGARDTWVWNGTNWTQKVPATSPTASWLYSLAYDARSSRILLFGGADVTGFGLTETWVWDGSTWSQLLPQVHPNSLVGNGPKQMTYDEARRAVLLFGRTYNAGNYGAATWLWQ